MPIKLHLGKINCRNYIATYQRWVKLLFVSPTNNISQHMGFEKAKLYDINNTSTCHRSLSCHLVV